MSEQSSDTGTRADWIKTNQGVGVVLTASIVILLVYLLNADWVYEELRDGFRLGFFTIFSAVTMLLCTVALIFDSHRHEIDKDVSALTWRDWGVAGISTVACFVYFQLAWNFDFLLVSPVFLTVGMYLFGVRPVRSAITSALIMTAIVYILFRLIGIELPTFIIWF